MGDQVLCKKHQLKALKKQHASWMKQREEALAKEGSGGNNESHQQAGAQQTRQQTQAQLNDEAHQPKVKTTFTVNASVITPNDDKELDEMNDFLTAVGMQLDEQ